MVNQYLSCSRLQIVHRIEGPWEEILNLKSNQLNNNGNGDYDDVDDYDYVDVDATKPSIQKTRSEKMNLLRNNLFYFTTDIWK